MKYLETIVELNIIYVVIEIILIIMRECESKMVILNLNNIMIPCISILLCSI